MSKKKTVLSKPRKPVLELMLPDWKYDKIEATLKSKQKSDLDESFSVENYQLSCKDGVCKLGLDDWSRTAILERPSNPFVDESEETLEDSYVLETLKGEYEFKNHLIRIIRLEERKPTLPFPVKPE